ncbi:MAG: histidine phosphatase family protein [Pseudomonadales bacterium]
MAEQKTYRQARFIRPAGATEIILVRHGESRAASVEQPFPLIDGQGDPELSAEGREQAEKLGARLKHQHIDAVYVTTLRRTRETAAPLCALKDLQPQTIADLREVHLGDWEGGLFRVKAHEQHPSFLAMQENQDWGEIPGAESNAKLGERVERGLSLITESHPDQVVMLVVHGGVIGNILANATGSAPFAFLGADNASISHIVAHNGRITLRRFNDTNHLSERIGAELSMPT